MGGIEWGLPVEERGYAWGEPWGVSVLPVTSDQAALAPGPGNTVGAGLRYLSFSWMLPLPEELAGRGIVLTLLDAASLPVLHYDRVLS